MVEYSDKSINCVECGNAFTFSASEQEFFASKGFTNEPKRCPRCRQARKGQRNTRSGGGQKQRQMYEAVCAECGKTTSVPFEPKEGRPVYCNECFASRRDSDSLSQSS
ncbi:MAG: zinc-ribbon domain containing protein [Chloroflexi bacterium]|nr:zinc-ribbon domain containing protein [Chloroflexota bacterium]